MKREEVQTRAMMIGLRSVKLAHHLCRNEIAKMMIGQLVRSSTSIGANYSAACLAKSHRDFINKLKIVEEETDETLYWLGFIEKAGWVEGSRIDGLKKETKEMLLIIVASIKTAKQKKVSSPNPK
jgi:four helix bundle protein